MTKKETVRVLGIDQGLANTGFAVLEPTVTGKAKVIESGYIITKRNNTRQDEGLPGRINEIETYYQDKITRFKPTHIITEDLFFGKNGIKEALYISGIIFNLAHRNDVLLIKYPPSEVKEEVTGNGKADKLLIIQTVKELVEGAEHFPDLPANFNDLDEKEQTKQVRIIEKNSHEADAIAIALSAIRKDFKNLSKEEKEINRKAKAKEKRRLAKEQKQTEKEVA